MPKTWTKQHNWIFETKRALNENYQKFAEDAEEVEKRQNDELEKTEKELKASREELEKQNVEIVSKGQDMERKRDGLQKQIDDSKQKHEKYTSKLENSKNELNDNRNRIKSQKDCIQSNEKMIGANKGIEEALDKVEGDARKQIEDIESSISASKEIKKLEKELEEFKTTIKERQDGLTNQSNSTKSEVNKQLEDFKTKSAQVYGSYINTIKECLKFTKEESHNQFTDINEYCNSMSEVPKYDGSKLKSKLEARDKALQELEQARSDYMEL